MTDVLIRDAAIKERRTPAGKQLGVANVKNSPLYRAQWEDGGELPDVLKNKSFTRIEYCDREIVLYLNKVWDEYQAQEQRKETKEADTARRASNRKKAEEKYGTKATENRTEPEGVKQEDS